jgi:hypothetical protein
MKLDPASCRAGRDKQSADRLHVPAARMKQRERRPADPGACPQKGNSSIRCVPRWPGSSRHAAAHLAPARAKCARSNPHQPTRT